MSDKRPGRAARAVMAGALALAPVAAADTLARTPSPMPAGGVRWCCPNPERLGSGPQRPSAPAPRPFPGMPGAKRLRRGRVVGQVADVDRLRSRLRRRHGALAGPARFVATRADGSKTLALLIDGMHCGACIDTLEQALGAVPGVAAARASLAAGRVSIEWGRGVDVDPGTLVRAVEACGYGARAYDPRASEAPLADRRRAWLMRLAVAGFGALATMFLAEPLYWQAPATAGADLAFQQVLRWGGMVVGTATGFYAAGPFVRGAFTRRRLGMDALVTLAVATTWLASLWGFFTHGAVYFDSLTMFMFLLVGARFAESTVRAQVLGAVERQLGDVPDTARLVRRGGLVQKVATALLAPGDVVRLRAGERVPADGVVVAGGSAVDEAVLTGESLPRARGLGDAVPGGAMVVEGTLDLRLTRVGADATQARLAALVAAAERPTARAQRLADVAGHWGTLAVLATAALTGLGWWWIDPSRALPAVVAVLVVTCPCALGLAIPAALVRATARALGMGLLVKRGEALEDLAEVAHVVFDKTGTLTTGSPRVVALRPAPGVAPARLLGVAAALEAGSAHPLALAIGAYADAQLEGEADLLPSPGGRGCPAGAGEGLGLRGFVSTPGLGVAAELADGPALAGSAAFLAAAGHAVPALADDLAAAGHSLVWVVAGGAVLGAIALADAARPEAAATLARLRAAGVSVSLLSGDHPAAAQHLAAQLGITEVQAGATPEAKRAAIATLRARHGRIAMVGDGLNDAPALAAADVGLAIARGADLATEACDMVILGGRLAAVADALDLARATRRTIRGNLAISAAYNALAIPLAVAGLVGPLLAAVLMPASSLLVLAHSWRAR